MRDRWERRAGEAGGPRQCQAFGRHSQHDEYLCGFRWDGDGARVALFTFLFFGCVVARGILDPWPGIKHGVPCAGSADS